jgi:hypothetical protein
MLLIEVNLSLDAKRKLLKMSRETGKSFGQLTALALDDFMEEYEQRAAAKKTEATPRKLELKQ